MSEDKKAGGSPAKDKESEEANDSSDDTRHRGNPLFQSSATEAPWKTVPKKRQETKARNFDSGKDVSWRGGRSSRPVSSRGRGHGTGSSPNKPISQGRGPEKQLCVEGPGRTGRDHRGRGSDNRPGRPRGRGATNYRSDNGYILDVLYERNKLYVLGLRSKTTKDCVLNFIARISRCDVKHVLMFKCQGRSGGRAIVTLDTDKITNTDFAMICEEAAKPKNQLEKVNVLIERAPVCKSVFVRGIPENTPQEEVASYFDRFGVVEEFVTNEEDVKAQRVKEKMAIVYFKTYKSVKKVVVKDHFLNRTTLHVERYYPFMGTVEDVNAKLPNPPTEIPVLEQPYFRMVVDVDIIEFVTRECNQGLILKDRLFSERAQINCTNKDGYVLVKYNQKPDYEFDEDVWENRCREIITGVLDSFAVKDIPVEKEIWEEVINQLPRFKILFPTFSADVKKFEDLKGLKLVCHKKDLPAFEEKLLNRLKEIKQTELEKTLEQKTLTNHPNEILRLLQIVDIQEILKGDVHQDVQATVDLSKKSIFLKTPEGQMSPVVTYLDKRVQEIEKNSLSGPPAEIIEILKTKVGKRKFNAELKESNVRCGFNVDEKNKRILFLGRTPSDTEKGRKLAVTVLVTAQIPVKDRDNSLLLSDEWKQLCRNCEKRLKIRCQRRLMEFHVIGLKKDVGEAVKEMRRFLNEKTAKEGEFRFDSPISQRFFRDFYTEEIKNLEESLSTYSVKIEEDENGDLLFTGADEGVKKVSETLNALQDDIKEKTVNVTLPGMRSFLEKDESKLIGAVEKEHRCVIEIEETTGENRDHEDDSGEESTLSSDEEYDEDDCTMTTSEGKKIIWKLGNIEEEEADSLVCSVGSNLNLSIGSIARAFNQAAGPALQDALKNAKKNNLNPGEVVHIEDVSGKLSCKNVLFCVCCPWNDGKGDAKQTLQTLLWKCFDKASQLGSCSIALPLIGTGNLNFPYDFAVQMMVEEALSYSEQRPNSSLEELRFIVHSKDQEGMSTFQEKFGPIRKEQQRRLLVPSRPLTGHANRRRQETPTLLGPTCAKVRIGDFTVEVVKGDVTKERTDGIISVVHEDLKMQNGNLSASIASASGSTVQDELTAKFAQQPGSVVTTSAGYLAAKYIIHMVISSGNKNHLQKCVHTALKEVHSMGLTSVSIPAIGSGGLGLCPSDSAEVVLGAVRAFLETVNSSGMARELRVVVLEDTVAAAFQSKLEEIKRELHQASRDTKEDDVQEKPGFVQLPISCYQHRVTVYGHQEVLDKAIAALKNGVNKECRSVEMTEDVISRLPKRCKRDLKQKARQKDVVLDFSKEGVISLNGFPSDVLAMQPEVSIVLHDQVKKEHKVDCAEMTAGKVQWCYYSVKGKQEPFDKMANYDIETAFQSKTPSVSFTHKNMQAEIIFDSSEVQFVKTGARKCVFRKEVVELPQEWDSHPLDAKGRKERVHLVRLDIDSPEYRDVQDRFMQGILDGRVSISSIQRVQNPSMYRSYVAKKQSMDEKNGIHKNERRLFHGTGYHNVKDINAHGLNRSFCGQHGTTFGDGVYFSTDSFVSLGYSKKANAKGEYCMYLAKVLVGKFALGKSWMKAPPPIDPDRIEHVYDSVVDSLDIPTVFVIFHDDQCYPEHLITFTIKGG